MILLLTDGALAASPTFDGEVRMLGSLPPDVVVDADGTSTGQGFVLDSRVRLAVGQALGSHSLQAEVDAFSGQLVGDSWDLGVTDDERHREAFTARTLAGVQPRRLSWGWRGSAFGVEAGLVTSDWGLGVVANGGGDDPQFGRTDGGDRNVRLRLGTMPVRGDAGELLVFLAGDAVVADDLSRWWLGQRTYQGVGGVLWRGSGESAHLDALGTYLVYRDQTEPDGLHTRAGVGDAFCASSVPAGAGTVHLAAEAVAILGRSDRARTYGHPEGSKVQSAGAALRADWRTERGGVFLHTAWASGDGNPDDSVVHDFTFDRNHDVGMVLFDEVGAAIEAGTWRLATDPGNTGVPPEGIDTVTTEGAFRRAFAVQLAGELSPTPWLRTRLGMVQAWSTAPIAQAFYSVRNGGVPTTHHNVASTGRALGTEVDAAIAVEGTGGVKPAGELQFGHALLSKDLAGDGPASATLVLATGRLRW